MQRYGLIGKPLSHSFSAKYFNNKFKMEGIKARYDLFELNRAIEVKDLIKQVEDLHGLNVTVPYKTTILPMLQWIDEEAKSIGAVNCIRIVDGKLKGYNTDAPAFYDTLKPMLQRTHKQALVLGTGGSSMAIVHALKKLNIAASTVSSSGKGHFSYDDLKHADLSPFSIVVNCTPLGMYPNTHTFPVFPMNVLNANWIVYDLVYNPEKTHFMQGAEKRGAIVKNGMEMLTRQADLSWEIWNEDLR